MTAAKTGLVAALIEAQGEMESPKKTAMNPHFRSRYADLAGVLDACMGALRAHGLTVIQTVDTDERGDYLASELVHVGGESRTSRYPLRPVKADPQGLGSALTYARRYSVMALVGIAPEDDDGHAATNRERVPDPPAPAPGGDSCPRCGVVGSIIKGKAEYGGGYLCFKKKGGCGAKFETLEEVKQAGSPLPPSPPLGPPPDGSPSGGRSGPTGSEEVIEELRGVDTIAGLEELKARALLEDVRIEWFARAFEVAANESDLAALSAAVAIECQPSEREGLKAAYKKAARRIGR